MKCPDCGKPVEIDQLVCPHCQYDFGGETVARSEDSVDTVEAKVEAGQADKPTQIGKYQILKELGHGGMGVVYLAEDPDLKRKVAIKTMIAGEAASEEAIARFMGEAQAAGKLQHAAIVNVHEVGQERSLHYMVMDYIEGRDLKELIGEAELKPRRAAEIMRDAARALHYAHERSIIHRDIKPANIMIANEGSVHLMDFGLARNLDSDSSLTKSGEVMGTPAYLNPEQAGGRSKQVDARSDVYSLGAVMYEMLTAVTVVSGDNLMQMIYQVLERDPVKPSRLNARIPKDLEVICLKALFKEPDRRYPSAAAMADDLERFLEGEAIHARPASLMYQLSRRARKHGKILAVVGTVIIAAVVLLWAQNVRSVREQTRLEGERQTAEDQKRRLAAAYTRKVEEIRKDWVPVYSQYFYQVDKLTDEWELAGHGLVKDHALFLDGGKGLTAAWLQAPIKGREWKVACDSWPAGELIGQEAIGLHIRSSRERQTQGLQVIIGGSNQASVMRFNGQDIINMPARDVVKAGHRYHIIVTNRNDVLRLLVIDTTAGQTVIDARGELKPGADAAAGDSQGFWTRGGRIFVDNIVISELGVPPEEAFVAAEELEEILGALVAVEYLLEKLDGLSGPKERMPYFRQALEIASRGKAPEQADLSNLIAAAYIDVFSPEIPSRIMQGDELIRFYRVTAASGIIDKVGNADLRDILARDAAFSSHAARDAEKPQLSLGEGLILADAAVEKKAPAKAPAEAPAPDDRGASEKKGDAFPIGGARETAVIASKAPKPRAEVNRKLKKETAFRREGRDAGPGRKRQTKGVAPPVPPPVAQVRVLPMLPDGIRLQIVQALGAGNPDQAAEVIEAQLKSNTDKPEIIAGLKQSMNIVQAARQMRQKIKTYFQNNQGREITLNKKDGSKITGKVQGIGEKGVAMACLTVTEKGVNIEDVRVPVREIKLRQCMQLGHFRQTDRHTMVALYLMAKGSGESHLAGVLKRRLDRHILVAPD